MCGVECCGEALTDVSLEAEATTAARPPSEGRGAAPGADPAVCEQARGEAGRGRTAQDGSKNVPETREHSHYHLLSMTQQTYLGAYCAFPSGE